jgi:hypothetical protein
MLPNRQVYRPYAGVQGLILFGLRSSRGASDVGKGSVSLVSGLGCELKLDCA